MFVILNVSLKDFSCINELSSRSFEKDMELKSLKCGLLPTFFSSSVISNTEVSPPISSHYPAKMEY